jgi:hypothetical protein
MFDIARSTNAALFANLRNRLNDFHTRSLATARLAPGICGNALNGRTFRQCMQV